jgi:hypothetical protein
VLESEERTYQDSVLACLDNHILSFSNVVGETGGYEVVGVLTDLRRQYPPYVERAIVKFNRASTSCKTLGPSLQR